MSSYGSYGSKAMGAGTPTDDRAPGVRFPYKGTYSHSWCSWGQIRITPTPIGPARR